MSLRESFSFISLTLMDDFGIFASQRYKDHLVPYVREEKSGLSMLGLRRGDLPYTRTNLVLLWLKLNLFMHIHVL